MSETNSRTPSGPPPHFLVLVPGYMGSQLRDRTSGQVVWIDFSTIPVNPFEWETWVTNLLAKMRYPNPDLEPAGIVKEVVFVPPLFKQEQYGRLITALEQLGYVGDETLPEKERNLYCFSYDWRQDNRLSGRQLGQAVDHWCSLHPGAKAWLIGHSNGGIVSRWYIEKEGGQDKVGRLFLMASPWDGAPKAMHVMFSGLDTLFRPGFNLFNIPLRTRDLVRTFPSAYQLLPVVDPFLHDANNQVIDPFTGQGWLSDPAQIGMLTDGRRFNQELGTTLSVETLCFFGRQLSTTTAGLVRYQAGGAWQAVDWADTSVGDGTVPERSAVHPHASARLPFVASHGDIYVLPAVFEFLRWELVDKYLSPALTDTQVRERAAKLTPHLQVLFNVDASSYAPGGEIRAQVRVTAVQTNLAVSDAEVSVTSAWRGSLPGSNVPNPPASSPRADLFEELPNRGLYTGSLPVPSAPGYYSLKALVKAIGEPAVDLEEWIAVEAPPKLD